MRPSHPQIGIGAVIFNDNRVLLVKRNKEPHKGEWAIPGGSVRFGETLQEAVQREIREETGLTVKAKEVLHVFDLIQRDTHDKVIFHYVIVDFAADLIKGELHPSDDASDAQWFSPEQVLDIKLTGSTMEFLKKISFIS